MRAAVEQIGGTQIAFGQLGRMEAPGATSGLGVDGLLSELGTLAEAGRAS